MKKIAFAGTDGRTILSALIVATAKSDNYPDAYQGIVVRGTPAMPKFVELMNWPIQFIPTASNSVADYAESLIRALQDADIDYIIPMPEALLFEGLVDAVVEAGFGNHIIGLSKAGAFIEGDKLKGKILCRKAGIPVAQGWVEVDAQNYDAVLGTCLKFIAEFSGAVLKYP